MLKEVAGVSGTEHFIEYAHQVRLEADTQDPPSIAGRAIFSQCIHILGTQLIICRIHVSTPIPHKHLRGCRLLFELTVTLILEVYTAVWKFVR